MPLSKVRLDSLPGTFELRVYRQSGDSSTPIAEEMREFCGRGLVTVAGNAAAITGFQGAVSDSGAWRDLDTALRAYGVTEAFWERHKNGRVLIKRRRIKAADRPAI